MIETPFTSLSREASRALVDASRVRDLAAGEQIFVQGEIGGSLFLVTSGLVAVQMHDADRQAVTVALRGPGEMLGEMSLFAASGRRTASATARASTRLLELESAAGVRVRSEHRELDDLFLRILAERSAALSRRLAQRGSTAPDVLVARTVLDLPASTGPAAPAPVTAADVAGICGLSKGQVETALETFARGGLIALTQDPETLQITDRRALTQRASLP
jgi:CRP-like cAMP-binding protein